MAGGKGNRFGLGEKPLAELGGRPLIDYVVAALRQAHMVRRVYAAVSPNTPETARHLEKTWRGGVNLIETPGAGYVEDLKCAARHIGSQAILVCPADMPFLRGELLDFVAESFLSKHKPSLVVVVPLRLVSSLGLKPTMVMEVDGEKVVPSGVNIINGLEAARRDVLEECYLTLDLEEFAVNVNTASDLDVAERLLHRLRNAFTASQGASSSHTPSSSPGSPS